MISLINDALLNANQPPLGFLNPGNFPEWKPRKTRQEKKQNNSATENFLFRTSTLFFSWKSEVSSFGTFGRFSYYGKKFSVASEFSAETFLSWLSLQFPNTGKCSITHHLPFLEMIIEISFFWKNFSVDLVFFLQRCTRFRLTKAQMPFTISPKEVRNHKTSRYKQLRRILMTNDDVIRHSVRLFDWGVLSRWILCFGRVSSPKVAIRKFKTTKIHLFLIVSFFFCSWDAMSGLGMPYFASLMEYLGPNQRLANELRTSERKEQ